MIRLVLLPLFAASAMAANIHCAPSATGDGSGTDWNNKADGDTVTLTRGNTYYFADGTYADRTWSTAVSGTTLITIKKAIESDHGSSTGWSSADGDGQAVFGNTIITTNYWEIDGQSGGGPGNWTTGFGIKFSATGAGDGPAISLENGSTGADNITLRHIEIEGNGGDSAGNGNDALVLSNFGCSNITVSYGYFHDMGRVMCYGGYSASNILFEYVYFGEYESVEAEHAELAIFRGMAGTVTWRYNVFTHCEGTGLLVGGEGTSTMEIYGNIFHDTDSSWIAPNGVIGAFTGSGGDPVQVTNWRVYNNHFINIDQTIFYGGVTNGPSGCIAKNNYFYSCTTPGSASWGTTTHNHYQDSGAGAGTNATTGTGDPFVNLAGGNYALSSDTTAGDTGIDAQYRTDALGNTGPTRGALQFVSGPTNVLNVTTLNIQ